MKRIVALAGIGLMASIAGAQAQEGVFMKDVLSSIGIIPGDRPQIDYRERAPLVLPPKMELRAPAGPESFASNNPQWPNDPDLVARKRRAAEARVPVTESETRRMSDISPQMTPDELRRGRNPNGPGPGRHKGERDGVWLSPAELQATARAEDDKVASAAPVRRTLTDPPTPLRLSARGREVGRDFQPRVDQQERDANPMNWLTRAFRSDEDE